MLNSLPFLTDQGIHLPYYDIANPYGYGGPIFSGESLEEAVKMYKDFNLHFIEYCQNEKIASEFSSFHPLLGNHELIINSELVNIHVQKEIIYLDLSVTEKELWQGINRGHKSGINKARKNGVCIEKVELTIKNIEVFNKLYFETMKRNKATERWFFPKDYLYNCYKSIGPNRISLFFAYAVDKVISSYLLIHDFGIIYYHFGGSDSKYFKLRANNLLMYETALWGKKQGYKKYHLGGGVSSNVDDNLFLFKSGFSKKKATLYVYHRIHNQKTYEYLCRLKIDHEIKNYNKKYKTDYFPLYRR